MYVHVFIFLCQQVLHVLQIRLLHQVCIWNLFLCMYLHTYTWLVNRAASIIFCGNIMSIHYTVHNNRLFWFRPSKSLSFNSSYIARKHTNIQLTNNHYYRLEPLQFCQDHTFTIQYNTKAKSQAWSRPARQKKKTSKLDTHTRSYIF